MEEYGSAGRVRKDRISLFFARSDGFPKTYLGGTTGDGG